MHAKPGDIFVDQYADFFEVVSATEKTVELMPIAGKTVELIDQWESTHEPCPGQYMEHWRYRGKKTFRKKVYNFSASKSRSGEFVKITDSHNAYLFDGAPALRDTYN